MYRNDNTAAAQMNSAYHYSENFQVETYVIGNVTTTKKKINLLRVLVALKQLITTKSKLTEN